MVDENKSGKIIKLTKIGIIVIVIGIIIFLILNYFMQKSNEGKLEDYLEKEGFTESENVWSKDEKETNGDTVTNITYLYTPNINKFTKDIQINAETDREQYRFKYNGNDTISVNYIYNGVNENNCMAAQTATYNYKTEDFSCDVTYNSGNCPLHCDRIQTESKTFGKELKEVLDKSEVNQFFLVKNKD